MVDPRLLQAYIERIIKDMYGFQRFTYKNRLHTLIDSEHKTLINLPIGARSEVDISGGWSGGYVALGTMLGNFSTSGLSYIETVKKRYMESGYTFEAVERSLEV